MAQPLNLQQWEQIRGFFGQSSHATSKLGRGVPYCAIATVDLEGTARAAPISSLLLKADRQACYFDHFSVRTAANLDRDQRLCVLIVNNQLRFWKKAVLLGRFGGPPAVRLFGVAGARRLATEEELAELRRPLRWLRLFRGHRALWGVMQTVRDLHFDRFEPIRCAVPEFRSID
jgi:hypothetical protein